MTTALIRLFYLVAARYEYELSLNKLHGCLTNGVRFYFELIPLFMNMWLQRRSISWSLFVVSLTTVRFASWNSNSFWSWFNSHILKNYKLIMLSPFYNGVEAPLSYVERLVETLHPNLVFCKQMHKAPIMSIYKCCANRYYTLLEHLTTICLSVLPSWHLKVSERKTLSNYGRYTNYNQLRRPRRRLHHYQGHGRARLQIHLYGSIFKHRKAIRGTSYRIEGYQWGNAWKTRFWASSF